MGNARLGLAIVLSLSLACAGLLRPIEGELPPVLGPDEGILLVEVVSNSPIKRIRVSGAPIREIPEGYSQRLFVIKAGEYRWQSIATQQIVFRLGRDEKWAFRVEAGRINYPGQLSTYTKVSHVWKRRVRMVGRMEVYSRNRSAIARAELLRSFPQIVGRYPMVYTGHIRDEFLQHFEKVRRELQNGAAEPGAGSEAESW